MKSSRRIVLTVLALSWLTGCASFGDVSKLTLKPWPPEAVQNRKTISLAYGAGVFNELPEKKRRHYIVLGSMCQTTDELGTVICRAQQGVPPSMLLVFQESGFFSEVKTDGSATDLKADIKTLVRNVQNPGGAMLVGLTLFLVPAKVVEHDLVVRATFKDKDDKVLGKFEGRATGSQWLGLLSVFGLPFRDISFEETENAAYRAILIEARQKGIV